MKCSYCRREIRQAEREATKVVGRQVACPRCHAHLPPAMDVEMIVCPARAADPETPVPWFKMTVQVPVRELDEYHGLGLAEEEAVEAVWHVLDLHSTLRARDQICVAAHVFRWVTVEDMTGKEQARGGGPGVSTLAASRISCEPYCTVSSVTGQEGTR